MHGRGLSIATLLLWQLCVCISFQPFVFASASRNDTKAVQTDLELQQALADPQVQHIVLLRDVEFQQQNWQRDEEDSSSPAVLLRRNVTISSQPRFNRLDFAFLARNWVKLASGVLLNYTDTVLVQSRYGVGMQLDFVAPSAGAIIVFWNVIVVRHLCINNTDEPLAIALMPRIPGFPGEQRAHYQQDQCLRDVCIPKVLVYDDFAKLSAFTVDSAAGGYSMLLHNTTKFCLGWARQCTDSSLAEACLQRALDAQPGAAPTPGRSKAVADAAEAAREAASNQKRQQTAVAAAIGSAVGAAVLLLLLLFLVLRQRSWRGCGGKNNALPFCKAAAGDSVLNQDQSESGGQPAHQSIHIKDVQVVARPVTSSGSASATASASVSASTGSHNSRPLSLGGSAAAALPAAVQQDPGCMQDSWELAAWKTSSHSLRRLPSQQQQVSVSDLVVAVDSGQFSTSSSAGGTLAGKALTSHDLILHGTGASTSQAVLAVNKVSLGVCIGAGSFGRVYKGRWRGMDVAVKVVQHSQAAAPSVANEIDLMMGFHHPHLVSAYHFVTWRRRKAADQPSSEQQAVQFGRQNSLSSGSLSCGNSFPAIEQAMATPPAEEERLVDTQTWIVQEYCDAGNLGDYCIIHGDRQDGQLPTGHAMLRLLFRLREVADAMQYLHDTARVVHGDLKSSNILLSVAPTAPYGRTAKVADFGLSKTYSAGETHRSTKSLGTINHMAPELLRFGKASAAADVYSYGIMMWELLTGQVAFTGWQWGAIIENVALSGQRPPIPEDAPEDYRLLMESCWHQKPQQRPTFEQVLQCLSMMITSRQQELAAGQVSHVHTLSVAQHAGTSHQSLSNPAHTGQGVDEGTAASNGSNGEFDMLRVGSMRGLSGISNSTYSGSNLPSGPASQRIHSSPVAVALVAVGVSVPAAKSALLPTRQQGSNSPSVWESASASNSASAPEQQLQQQGRAAPSGQQQRFSAIAHAAWEAAGGCDGPQDL